MTPLQIAQVLVEIGDEVSDASNRAARSIQEVAGALQSLSAVNRRIHAVVHELLADGPLGAPPDGGLHCNTSFGENGFGGVADFEETEDGRPASGKAPQAHGDRGTVTASPEAGVGKGSAAVGSEAVVGTAVGQPEAEQVAGAVSGSTEAAPELSGEHHFPGLYDRVLDRFADVGSSHGDLAQRFGVTLGRISRCLDFARKTNDPRVARGDVKRLDMIERDAVRKPVYEDAPQRWPSDTGLPTVPPRGDDEGNPIAEVVYTDGLARRLDTMEDVRMPGQHLRVVALLKDQFWHGVEDTWRHAGRYRSEAVFRSHLPELQAQLSKIGLHIHEETARGFQLRRIAETAEIGAAA